MRTVSEKYANSSKYYMDDTDLFSTETITVPIVFSDCSRLLNCLCRKQSEKYSAKWDRGFNTHISTWVLSSDVLLQTLKMMGQHFPK